MRQTEAIWTLAVNEFYKESHLCNSYQKRHYIPIVLHYT